MKRLVLACTMALAAATGANAQLTLNECRAKAQDNYPLVRQYELIERAREYDLSNVGKGYLPQFSLSGKVSYQSDVTKLPVSLPGIEMKGLPKDQYQLALEVQQTLWDGGNIRSRKELVRASAEVDAGQQRVDMYALNDRVDEVFFGILLLDEQLKQNQLLHDDLQRTHQQVSAYMANGIANQSDLDAVSVELINARQKRVALEMSRGAYLTMLSAFVGTQLPPETLLQKPVSQEDDLLLAQERANHRPELNWFDRQSKRLDLQESTLKTNLMPRFALFVQGGYGNPALNMLKDEFSGYYVAGVRMSWNFGSLYTWKNDRRLIDNNRRKIEIGRDVFLFNTRLETARQDAEITAIRKQMKEDDEIIRLRANIRGAAEAKVANGTLTVTDMLREITSENLAKQTKALHEIQLLMNIRKLKYTLNQ